MNMVLVSDNELMEVDGGKLLSGKVILGAIVGGMIYDGVKSVANKAYNELQAHRRSAPRHPGHDNTHGNHLRTGFTF